MLDLVVDTLGAAIGRLGHLIEKGRTFRFHSQTMPEGQISKNPIGLLVNLLV